MKYKTRPTVQISQRIFEQRETGLISTKPLQRLALIVRRPDHPRSLQGSWPEAGSCGLQESSNACACLAFRSTPWRRFHGSACFVVEVKARDCCMRSSVFTVAKAVKKHDDVVNCPWVDTAFARPKNAARSALHEKRWVYSICP